jgi:hypothetical protein
LDESILQDAVLEATARFVKTSPAALDMLKQHIGIGLSGRDADADDPYAIQARVSELETEINALYIRQRKDATGDYDGEFERLYGEKKVLGDKLAQIKADSNHASAEQSRLDEIFTVTDGLRNRPLLWDEVFIRQMVECIKVVSRDRIRIRFRLGVEMDAGLTE